SFEDVGAFFGTGNSFDASGGRIGIFAYGDGTPGGQEIVGTPFGDYMAGAEFVAGSGNGAIFHGEGGNDYIDAAAGDDTLYGGEGNDILVPGTGDDMAFGEAGNDVFYFGNGAMTPVDAVTGGSGVDTLVLQGNYSAGLVLDGDVTEIEGISLLAGTNTSFGDPGTNLYDYNITTDDANFAAGLQVRVNGSALLAGEDFTFNGAAETDSSFVVYGGKGKDTLTGGLGNDIFFFSGDGRFAAGDRVDGGEGYDGLFLRGNYTLDLSIPGFANAMQNMENMTLSSASDTRYARGGGTEFDYTIVWGDGLLAEGGTLTVNGAGLQANETMNFDGTNEADGRLLIYAGAAADTLKGGSGDDVILGGGGADSITGNAGSDTFQYNRTSDSISGASDTINDFEHLIDVIDLTRIDANTLAAGNQGFSFIGANAFGGTGAASAGELRVYESGGTWFVEGDTNGDGTADLVISVITTNADPLDVGDFRL
ncbi:MAG TPA: calcium-binding protein, partial [Allosphingosinicella sp.]|nr:calcium-binding protein [Allosphingosinicella sp.]